MWIHINSLSILLMAQIGIRRLSLPHAMLSTPRGGIVTPRQPTERHFSCNGLLVCLLFGAATIVLVELRTEVVGVLARGSDAAAVCTPQPATVTVHGHLRAVTTGNTSASPLVPPVTPPWKPASGDGEYNDGQRVSEWAFVTPAGSFVGLDVVVPHTQHQKTLVEQVLQIGVKRTMVASPGCSASVAISAWQVLDLWDRRDFLVLVHCTRKSSVATSTSSSPTAATATAAFNTLLFLVHVPLRGAMLLPQPSDPTVTVQVIAPAPVAVLVPYSCNAPALQAFLKALLPVLQSAEGARKRVVVATTACPPGADPDTTRGVAVEQVIARALAAHNRSSSGGGALPYQADGPAPRIEAVHFPGPFSRSAALNAALGSCSSAELAVVLDVDMTVTPQYLHHAQAFAASGAYFPITFSRYNEASVNTMIRFVNGTQPRWAEGLAAALQNRAVRAEVGAWRRLGYGMLSLPVSTAQRRALRYDPTNTQWGREDTEVWDFLRADQSRDVVWRAYDPSVQHLYHAKDCSRLVDASRRVMCMGSGVGVEGSQFELGLRVQQLQAALTQQQAQGHQRGQHQRGHYSLKGVR